MAYSVLGVEFVTNSTELVGINSCGILNNLYVGELVSVDSTTGILTAAEFFGDGSGLTGILTTGSQAGEIGILTVFSILDVEGDAQVAGLSTFGGNVKMDTDLEVAGETTTGSFKFTGAPAAQTVASITDDLDNSAGGDQLVTAEAAKNYVDSQIGAQNQLLFEGDTGNQGDIDLAALEVFTLAGTANQIESNVGVGAGNTITYAISSTLQLPGSLAFGAGPAVTSISVDGALVGATNAELASSLAVKTYVDNAVGGGGTTDLTIRNLEVTGLSTVQGAASFESTVSIENSLTLTTGPLLMPGPANNGVIGGTLSVNGAGVALQVPNEAQVGSLTINSTQTVNNVSTDGTFATPINSNLVSELAIKTYVDNAVGGGGTTDLEVRNLEVTGLSTFSSDVEMQANLSVTSQTTTGSFLTGDLTFSGGAQSPVDDITTDLTVSATGTELPTAEATKNYVDSQIGAQNQLLFQGDTGLQGDIDLAALEVFTLAGTTNQIESTVGVGAGNTVTYSISSTLQLPGTLAFAAGQAVNEITTDGTLATAADAQLASALAIKTYVDAQVGANNQLTFAGDAGTGEIDLATETFSINGTASQVETNVPGAGQGNVIDVSLSDTLILPGTLQVDDTVTINATVDVTGTVNATDFNTTSDLNRKTNLQPIEGALDKVGQLRGLTFDWKDGQGTSAGVIAQEVEAVLPEAVRTCSDAQGQFKAVNYNAVMGLLVEAIKDLQAEVADLRLKCIS